MFGMFPVILALECRKRTFHQIYLKDTFQWTLRNDIKSLVSLAEEKEISIKYLHHEQLAALSGGRPHQVDLSFQINLSIFAKVVDNEFL